MSNTHYLLAFFILLLVFLSPLVFLFFSSPPPSFEASSSFRFLSVELLTLTTVEFPRPALAIWFSAVVQSAESVSIAYLQWSRNVGGKDGTKVHVVSLRIAEISGTSSSETRHALRQIQRIDHLPLFLPQFASDLVARFPKLIVDCDLNRLHLLKSFRRFNRPLIFSPV